MDQSVGAQLKRARQEQRLKILDISEATKIQPWALEALEANQLQHSMSPIYVKGFLSSYARFLYLEPEPLVAALQWPKDEAEQEEVPPAAAPIEWSFQIPWEGLRALKKPALALVSIAIIVMINPLRFLPTIQMPFRQASISGLQESIASPNPKELEALGAHSLEVTMSVHHPTWVRVRADGKLLMQQRLVSGAQETWRASKQLELIVARPSQVELMLNGQIISPLAIAHNGRLLITQRGISRLPDGDL